MTEKLSLLVIRIALGGTHSISVCQPDGYKHANSDASELLDYQMQRLRRRLIVQCVLWRTRIMPSFGTLKADTLTHSTAGSLATNFVVNGSAKAWEFDATVSLLPFLDSLNSQVLQISNG